MQKHHKSRGYNLDDDEELTHYGQSLGDLENFDDADLKLTDDEQDDGMLLKFSICFMCFLCSNELITAWITRLHNSLIVEPLINNWNTYLQSAHSKPKRLVLCT